MRNLKIEVVKKDLTVFRGVVKAAVFSYVPVALIPIIIPSPLTSLWLPFECRPFCISNKST